MKAGELVIAYAIWEGAPGWVQITETNQWPPDTDLTTVWTVKNTGNEAAYFGVRFMELESAGVLLSPGEEGSLYLYPVTPGPGTYDYTLEIVADIHFDGQVVASYPIRVVTGKAEMNLLPLVIGGVALLGGLVLVAAMSVRR